MIIDLFVPIHSNCAQFHSLFVQFLQLTVFECVTSYVVGSRKYTSISSSRYIIVADLSNGTDLVCCESFYYHLTCCIIRFDLVHWIEMVVSD